MALLAFEPEPVEEMPVLLINNNSVGQTGEALKRQFAEDRRDSLRGSISCWEKFHLLRAKQQVCLLTRLQPNWDSYGAPSPNDIAVRNAIRVLDLLQAYEMEFARVLPSAEGGVGICFVNGDHYADIECLNDGDIMGVRYTGAEMPSLIEINGTDGSIHAGLEQIRNHLSA